MYASLLSAILSVLPAAADAANDARLSDLSFVDAQRGWAVGDRGGVWHTDNGGRPSGSTRCRVGPSSATPGWTCAEGELRLADAKGRPPKPILSCVKAKAKPRLDGRLDDPVWRQAKPAALTAKTTTPTRLGDARTTPSSSTCDAQKRRTRPMTEEAI